MFKRCCKCIVSVNNTDSNDRFKCMPMSEDELKALAAQLSKPEGEFGKLVAENMHESNIGMTLHAIECLRLKDHQHVLEIGHGNCGHLDKLLGAAKGLAYTGLEISLQMQTEAKTINAHLLSGDVNYLLYNGENLPFENDVFDAAYTVNTLYFWKHPAAFLAEVCRVLKQGAMFNLTFADKHFMETLAFTKYGFTLYSPQDAEVLIKAVPFSDYTYSENEEYVKSKSGDRVKRKFYTFSIIK